MLDALLFDLDGTLTDTDQLHLLAFQRLLQAQGRELTREEYEANISGRANPELCRYLFPEQSVEEHQRFADSKEALFRELAPELEPMRGLMRLLSYAAEQKWGLAVVTNAPRANADHMLYAIGLREHFHTVVVAEELARAKPDPLPYLTGLARLEASPERALAFEDSITGLTAAKNAGIFTVAIATTVSHQALVAAGAHLVIDDFEDAALWEILKRRASQ